jgi:hypothetical protein
MWSQGYAYSYYLQGNKFEWSFSKGNWHWYYDLGATYFILTPLVRVGCIQLEQASHEIMLPVKFNFFLYD